uniref:Uncharacterized protein n=1 Tax=Glossina austeni TaxID=7395 RepID=A0A1A9UZ88_GLOAU
MFQFSENSAHGKEQKSFSCKVCYAVNMFQLKKALPCPFYVCLARRGPHALFGIAMLLSLVCSISLWFSHFNPHGLPLHKDACELRKNALRMHMRLELSSIVCGLDKSTHRKCSSFIYPTHNRTSLYLARNSQGQIDWGKRQEPRDVVYSHALNISEDK